MGASGEGAFEKYFLHKVRKGTSEPAYERIVMKALSIDKLGPKRGGAMTETATRRR